VYECRLEHSGKWVGSPGWEAGNPRIKGICTTTSHCIIISVLSFLISKKKFLFSWKSCSFLLFLWIWIWICGRSRWFLCHEQCIIFLYLLLDNITKVARTYGWQFKDVNPLTFNFDSTWWPNTRITSYFHAPRTKFHPADVAPYEADFQLHSFNESERVV